MEPIMMQQQQVVQPMHTIGTVQQIGTIGTIGTVQQMHTMPTTMQYHQPVQTVQHVQPVQTIQHVQTVQAYQPVQHVTRDLPMQVRQEEHHQAVTIKHKYEYHEREKEVEVPVVQARDVHEDVHCELIEEEYRVINEATAPIELIEQMAEHVHFEHRTIYPEHIEYHQVDKIVEKAIHLEVEHIVPVETPVAVDLIKEMPQYVTQRIDKYVEKPVHHVKEIIEHVPAITVREVAQEVKQKVQHEILKEVPGEHTVQEVQKTVPKHEIEFVQVAQDFEVVQYEEHIVEVPQIEYREIVRQVPKIEVQIHEKKLPKIEYQYVERIVTVPHVVYEERIIEEPVYEIFERITKVPKAVWQLVDKHVPKTENHYHEKVIHEEQTIHQEVPVEVPVPVTVELTTQVPKATVHRVEKPVPVYTIQAHEIKEERHVVTHREKPVEVAQIQHEVVKRQVAHIQEQVREIVKQPKTTRVVIKEEVKPIELMRQKAQYVPQVQTIELIKEEPKTVIKQIHKSIPKYEMKYVNNIVKVGPKHMHMEEVVEWAEEWVFFDGHRIGIFTEDYLLERDEDQVIEIAMFMYQVLSFTEPFPFEHNNPDWKNGLDDVVHWILQCQVQYLYPHRNNKHQYQIAIKYYQSKQVKFVPPELLFTYSEKDLRSYAKELFMAIGIQTVGRNIPKSDTHDTHELLVFIQTCQSHLQDQPSGGAVKNRGLGDDGPTVTQRLGQVQYQQQVQPTSLFDQIDTNGNGTITRAELEAAMGGGMLMGARPVQQMGYAPQTMTYGAHPGAVYGGAPVMYR